MMPESPVVIKSENTFSIKQSTIFKGIGILMIVIHNYMHLIPQFALENEFFFKPSNIHNFFTAITDHTLLGFIGGLFGFLGHYGVQIFIFLSAYGLAIQYEKWNGSNKQFIFRRLKKIYFLLLYAVIFSVIFLLIIGISFGVKGTIIRALILGSTLSSITSQSMFNGPYWFFALIIQLYIVFPWLYRFVIKFNSKKIYIPLIISYIIIYILYFTIDKRQVSFGGDTFNLALFRNIIGHLPEVMLGLVMAHFKFRSCNWATVIIALIVFACSQINAFFFPLSFLSVTILLIPIFLNIERILNDYFTQTLLYVGEISMILFIVNGPLRSYPLFTGDPGHKFERIFLFLFVLFILSHILFKLYDFLRKQLRL